MIKLNIHEAKTHLSRLLAELGEDDVIVLCRRNVPVAEIRRVPRPRTAPRPIGLAKGSIGVPPAFFEPLPDELLAAFDGGDA